MTTGRQITLLIIIFFISWLFAAGQDFGKSAVKRKYPELLNSNNVGKEFWFTIPPCFEDESGGYNNFIKIFVTTPVRSKVRVSIPGKEFYTEEFTIPNDVIEFNISPEIGQPLRRRVTDPVPPDQVYTGAGIHLLADDPIVVYVVVRYKRTSDGFLAIPVASLGREYIAASYTEDPFFKSAGWGNLPSQVGIVAAFDDTRVEFKLGGNGATRTAGGLQPGQTASATLNKGDVWLFSSNSGGDLSGSLITSSKPVGVISGNQCANIPNGNQWCDYTVEMDLPTHTWGKFYHLGKVPGRRKSPLARVFAKYPETRVFRDGVEIAYLADAGGVIGKAFTEIRISPDNEAVRSAAISGDKPIGVTLYNTGVEEDGEPYPNSDPFAMVITPIEQYQNEIIFCTPAINGGESFKENYLNLIYETDEKGYMPDDMEFAQVFGGSFNWSKIKEKFISPDEPFKYDYYGKKFALKTIKLPSDGVFKIRSKNPFAAYSFGYDDRDSYGYPTSAALAYLIFRDTLAPDPKWKMNCDGSVLGATVTDKPDDPMVRSNLSAIVFHNDLSDNYDFKHENFIPGEAPTTTWQLKIKNPFAPAKAVITFLDRSGNDTTITISYNPPRLSIIPDQHDFGNFKIDETASAQFHVKNESPTNEAVISKIDFKLKNQGFSLILEPAFRLPYRLQPLGTLPFKVMFTAGRTGNFLDSVGVADTCLFGLYSEVRAKVGAPVISVTDAIFGRCLVGLSFERDVYIINEGNAPLVVTGYSGPTTNVFRADFGGRVISAANPLTIEPGDRFPFKIIFTPDGERVYSDKIIFQSDGDIADNECYMSGEGIKPKLWVSSENWGWKRIHRPDFPAGPYETSSAVILKNFGDEIVKIDKAIVNDAVNPSAFQIKLTDFENMEILPGDSSYVEVKFQPLQSGLSKLVLHFDTGSESDAQSTLEGIGTVPRMIADESIDFGYSIVGNTANPQIKIITITNENYEYSDPLTITDLIPDPPGAISTDGIDYSATTGFLIDKTALNLPIILNPSQSITFPAKFVAPKAGNFSAKLMIKSDAEEEKAIDFKGVGIAEGLDFIYTERSECLNSTSRINCALLNIGESEILVNSAVLNQLDNYFALENPDEFSAPFSLLPKQVRNFNLTYHPKSVGAHKLSIVFSNNSAHSPDYKVDLTANSFVMNRLIKPLVSKGELEIGEDIDFSLNLASGANISELAVKDIELTIKFNTSFLKIDKASLSAGAGSEGKFDLLSKDFNIIDYSNNIMEVKMKIAAIGDFIFNEPTELVKMRFKAYLPSFSEQEQHSENNTSSIIYASATVNNTDCLVISTETLEVKLKPICKLELRTIVYSGEKYSLGEIKPNPSGSDGANANFTIAISAWTEINIYNSSGALVSKLLAAKLEKGAYNLELPMEQFTSGVYFLEIKSGPFKETRKFSVIK